jgi:anti-anti-sigma factor
MKLQVSELEHGIRLIILNGKLDSSGVYAIEMDFLHHCAGESQRVLVDLSNVSYISSIGIPMLVNTAKIVARKGGKFALLSPQKNVMDVLELVGVTGIIPTYFDLLAAKQGFH